MSYSPEFDLLLAACRSALGFPVTEEAEKLVIRDGAIDRTRLYRRADMHSVRPQLAQLTAGFTPGLLPDDFITRIQKSYQDNLVDQISYLAEFMKIKGMLEQEGIVIVPFKGFRLAHDYYTDIGGREGGDIDVFTEFRHLGRIRELMLTSGYVIEKSMSDYTLKDLARRAGEYNFGKWEGERCLYHFEYHWRMTSPVYGMGISFDDLSSQVVPGLIQGQGLMRFSPSADLLLTVMHHGGKDPFNELKYVHDIAAIMRRQEEIDWEWVLLQARQFRLERLIYVALRLANELFDSAVPGKLYGSVHSDVVGRLARNRIRFMANSLEYRHPWITVNDWLFRIRTRQGLHLKTQLALYIAGVTGRRFLLPARWRRREVA
jgi:hypothetical protein